VFALVLALAGSDCERLRSGWLAQPANAVSSLAYLTIGVWLLWRGRRAGAHRSGLVAGGVAMVGVGVGSFAYHGPQPGWAHLAHDASAAWLTLVVIGQIGWRLAKAGDRRLAVAGLKAPAVCLGVALLAYVAGRTGSSLCHPAALWQPHAGWHVLSAVGAGSALLGCSRPYVQAHRTSRTPSMPAAR
jgi:hypothetical protein